MDCVDISQSFLSGGVPSGAGVAEHVARCAQCAELFVDRAALGRGLAAGAEKATEPIAEQLAATESLIARDRGVRAYLRSRSTRVRWAMSLGLPAVLLAVEFARRHAPLGELGVTRLVVGLGLLGFLALVAHSALSSVPSQRHALRTRSLALIAWCLPCALWLAPESPISAESLSSSGFALRSLSCFGYGSALSAPSFVLLLALDRGPYVSFRVWALAAGLVALLASLLLLLHCPSTNRAHLLAGHFSIGLVWFSAVSFASWSRRSA